MEDVDLVVSPEFGEFSEFICYHVSSSEYIEDVLHAGDSFRAQIRGTKANGTVFAFPCLTREFGGATTWKSHPDRTGAHFAVKRLQDA
jgi:hypothetical protein